MERLTREKKAELTAAGVHKFGILFYTLGIFGRSVLQNQLLGLNSEGVNLLDTLTNMPNGMLIATVALILQMTQTCAVPIFSFLLVEGIQKTSDKKKYLLRMAVLALASEIPYNLAYSGRLLDFGSRNPVFALLLSLILICFYERYASKSAANVLIKIGVTVAAMGWTIMLGVDNGICFILIVSVLWACRNKPILRVVMGCSATALCTLFSMYYLAAPMSFMIMHFYNGERGERNQKLDYFSYPVILTVIGVAALALF